MLHRNILYGLRLARSFTPQRANQILRCTIAPLQLSARCKYVQNKGVKGSRNRKKAIESSEAQEEEVVETMDANDEEAALNLDDREYDEIVRNAMHVTRDISSAQQVLVIQPYIKWGPKRNTQISSDDQLKEAEALVHSLPNWKVALSLKVPLESLERKTLFGTGKMEELKTLVQQQRRGSNGQSLTCLFISKSTLSFAQKRLLEMEFNLPVMDRYAVVIQILRLHATTAEARIQVAMAEIPYIWSQAKDENVSTSRKSGYSLTDTQREILRTRERKLKNELERIRTHRKLLRNKRKQKNYPIIAVVGYTNAGKTSLIKALTDEKKLQPRDQLFATLDVTAHAGTLPCNLTVIYMDTVGFMSDLPTGLIECFVATLEDAMLADVIIHVQDLSHACHTAQKDHVNATLQSLAQNISKSMSEQHCLPPIINVGNKIDLVSNVGELRVQEDIYLVSAKNQSGLHDLLQHIESNILTVTNRRKITIRVPNGGREMSWLYKNAAVVEVKADENNSEQLLMNVVISENVMNQFKRQFCQ